jgi:ATP-dependent Clp protease, protease subunit
MPAGVPADNTYAQLLEQRTVFLRGRLDGGVASRVVGELLVLDGDSNDPVTLIVNAQGGALDDGFAVIDALGAMRAPVDTVCLGQATGTAAAVVALGTGTRRVTPTARLDLRLGETVLRGRADDVGTQATAWLALRDRLATLLAERSGGDVEVITGDLDRGRPLRGEEAVAAGLADEVVDRR